MFSKIILSLFIYFRRNVWKITQQVPVRLGIFQSFIMYQWSYFTGSNWSGSNYINPSMQCEVIHELRMASSWGPGNRAGQEGGARAKSELSPKFNKATCSKISIPLIMISVAGASSLFFLRAHTGPWGSPRGLSLSPIWLNSLEGSQLNNFLQIKFSEESIWERELGKRKTVRWYTVVANMVFVQGRSSGKILTNNP